MEFYTCDKCDGRGLISITYEPIQIDSFGGMRQFVPGIGKENVCRKCLGSGKLDWIEVLFGKQQQKLSDDDVLKDITERLAKDLADQIDKEIMNSLLGKQE